MNQDQQPQPGAAESGSRGRPMSVFDVVSTVGNWMKQVPEIWVEGQVSDSRVTKMGVFFTLRDLEKKATLELLYRQRVNSYGGYGGSAPNAPDFTFSSGSHLQVRCSLEFWSSGKLILICHETQRMGLGRLLEELERLKAQLHQEGLFAEERKLPLPFLPRLIGLITARDSDAEKDVIRNAQLQWPAARFRVDYALMQGDRAPAENIAALRRLDADPEVDVIVIARGGGSFQDLFGFSDEQLIRAVAACRTPVVSAIGHDADNPLLDYVADLRASTPTDAAKRITPDVKAHIGFLAEARQQLNLIVSQQLQQQQALIESWRNNPLLRLPEQTLISPALRAIGQAREQLNLSLQRGLQTAQTEITAVKAHLDSLSPQKTLERGYAVASDSSGRMICDVANLNAGDKLQLRFSRGQAKVQVLQVLP